VTRRPLDTSLILYGRPGAALLREAFLAAFCAVAYAGLKVWRASNVEHSTEEDDKCTAKNTQSPSCSFSPY
jgi:hypothetical protein